MEKKKAKAQHKKPEITKATVQVKEHKVDVYTKAYNDTIERAGSVKENIKKRAGSVYTASYNLIDETIDDIKKMSRKVSTSDYSANNVYLILQDALKKITLAEK
jgi:galactokinase/mevalonate kinase-like predicted kinase